MNCNQIRQQLLQADDINQPSVELMLHFSNCSSCFKYHQEAIKMEKLVEGIPIPLGLFSPQNRLIKIESKLGNMQLSSPKVLQFRKNNPERARQKLALAVALVAFLFSVAVGLSFLPKSIDRESIAGLRHYKNSAISKAKTSLQKWNTLSQIASETRKDAIKFAARNDLKNLSLMADFLQELLEKDLEKLITFGEQRNLVNSLADDFLRSESEFQRLAHHYASSPELTVPLLKIALVSKQAVLRLRQALAL